MYYVRSIFLEYSNINTDKNNMTKIIIVIKPVIIFLKKIMMDIFFFSFFSPQRKLSGRLIFTKFR